MHLRNGRLRLSATDLARFLACPHLTELDRAVAEDRRDGSGWFDPRQHLLKERGFQHESAYVDHLRDTGKQIVMLDPRSGTEDDVLAAMRAGADVITQAVLRDDTWGGRADLLLRVDEPSDLGAWSYEVADTKLAQETRGGTVLQLCVYSSLLARWLGRPPTHLHVVRPGPDFPTDTFRLADYQAYFRSVQRRLSAQLESGPIASYPNRVPQCEICEWWPVCDRQRHDDDHPSLVAGILNHQIEHLHEIGIETLAGFARRSRETLGRPRRGSTQSLQKAWEQARVQLRGRKENQPAHDLLPLEPGLGLSRLPEPSAGDLFFDFEGDPFVEGGGLEYLFGFADGSGTYDKIWALGRADEKRALERFFDFLMARWEQHPDLHVYHFGGYERAALERLVGRHATRATELDRLLRAERLVDLHAITRQSLRASVERYSLKDLEPFFGFRRRTDLRDASTALRRIEAALELGLDLEAESDALETVRAYNEEDCLATAGLRAWLEGLRTEQIADGADIARPILKSGDASDHVEAREEQTAEAFAALVEGIPEDLADRSETEHARWLLAHLLDYFNQELKTAWWDYFRVHEMEPDDLLEERSALVGLSLRRRGRGRHGGVPDPPLSVPDAGCVDANPGPAA
ncbi:MAG: TM0106 family RecB-like putative nuclease [Candidatus Eisenbacteria bacterium]